ncbi:MAG: hypothetical protein ACPGMR_09220 [Pontibacterium sp.]
MQQKTIVLMMASPIIAGILGIGGFFAYQALSTQTEKNDQALASFGEGLAPPKPVSPHISGENILNEGVIAPTLEPEPLTPVERVINGLKAERSMLLADNKALRVQISDLEAVIAELEEYKRLNERFAPETLTEELRQVGQELKRLLLKDASIVRYDNRQVEIMTLASVEAYHQLLKKAYGRMTPEVRNTIISSSLAEYAFCVGEGVELAANNAAESRALLNYFETLSNDGMSTQLRNDLSLVMTPCDQAFLAQTAQYLP